MKETNTTRTRTALLLLFLLHSIHAKCNLEITEEYAKNYKEITLNGESKEKVKKALAEEHPKLYARIDPKKYLRNDFHWEKLHNQLPEDSKDFNEKEMYVFLRNNNWFELKYCYYDDEEKQDVKDQVRKNKYTPYLKKLAKFREALIRIVFEINFCINSYGYWFDDPKKEVVPENLRKYFKGNVWILNCQDTGKVLLLNSFGSSAPTSDFDFSLFIFQDELLTNYKKIEKNKFNDSKVKEQYFSKDDLKDKKAIFTYFTASDANSDSKVDLEKLYGIRTKQYSFGYENKKNLEEPDELAKTLNKNPDMVRDNMITTIDLISRVEIDFMTAFGGIGKDEKYSLSDKLDSNAYPDVMVINDITFKAMKKIEDMKEMKEEDVMEKISLVSSAAMSSCVISIYEMRHSESYLKFEGFEALMERCLEVFQKKVVLTNKKDGKLKDFKGTPGYMSAFQKKFLAYMKTYRKGGKVELDQKVNEKLDDLDVEIVKEKEKVDVELNQKQQIKPVKPEIEKPKEDDKLKTSSFAKCVKDAFQLERDLSETVTVIDKTKDRFIFKVILQHCHIHVEEAYLTFGALEKYKYGTRKETKYHCYSLIESFSENFSMLLAHISDMINKKTLLKTKEVSDKFSKYFKRALEAINTKTCIDFDGVEKQNTLLNIASLYNYINNGLVDGKEEPFKKENLVFKYENQANESEMTKKMDKDTYVKVAENSFAGKDTFTADPNTVMKTTRQLLIYQSLLLSVKKEKDQEETVKKLQKKVSKEEVKKIISDKKVKNVQMKKKSKLKKPPLILTYKQDADKKKIYLNIFQMLIDGINKTYGVAEDENKSLGQFMAEMSLFYKWAMNELLTNFEKMGKINLEN